MLIQLKSNGIICINGIICNAASSSMDKYEITKDGFESTFGTNCLGHVALCILLLPILASNAQIVNVSSSTHDPKRFHGTVKPDFATPIVMANRKPQNNEKISDFGKLAYTTSKLCNVMFTYSMVKHLISINRSDVKCFAFNPGLMPETGLYGERESFKISLYKIMLPIIALFPNPGFSDSKRSGKLLARLSIGVNPKINTGSYVSLDKVIKSSSQSYDEISQNILWEGTMKLLDFYNFFT